MKNSLYILAFLSISCTIFTACLPSKKMKASQAHIEELKQDSIESHRRLNEQNALAKKKKVAIVTTTTTTTVINSEDALTPLPPIVIKNKFQSSYPEATEIVWSKRMPIVKNENENCRDYFVYFFLQGNRNSAIYSEKGELMETREQILLDQLPPNIRTSIKAKYPNSNIISAWIIKHSKMKGSYTVMVITESHAQEKEFILTDNGTFID